MPVIVLHVCCQDVPTNFYRRRYYSCCSCTQYTFLLVTSKAGDDDARQVS